MPAVFLRIAPGPPPFPPLPCLDATASTAPGTYTTWECGGNGVRTYWVPQKLPQIYTVIACVCTSSHQPCNAKLPSAKIDNKTYDIFGAILNPVGRVLFQYIKEFQYSIKASIQLERQTYIRYNTVPMLSKRKQTLQHRVPRFDFLLRCSVLEPEHLERVLLPERVQRVKQPGPDIQNIMI